MRILRGRLLVQSDGIRTVEVPKFITIEEDGDDKSV